MIIHILPQAVRSNCHWYCCRVGQRFRADSFDERLNCYVVPHEGELYLVHTLHATIVDK